MKWCLTLSEKSPHASIKYSQRFHRSDFHKFKARREILKGRQKKRTKSIEFSSLAEAVWSCCALRLLWASGPLTVQTECTAEGLCLLVNHFQLLQTLPFSPNQSLKQIPSKEHSLGPRQKAACGFVFFSFCFFCSCYVLYLFESCIMLSLISVLLHRCQWFVDHLLAWHPHMAPQRHNSTRHPHLIASTITHGHFIRACLFTVVTLSFE